MAGVDVELAVARVTTGPSVRDLQVALWAEHLRTPLTERLRAHLEDLDLAVGIFRPAWLPPGAPPGTCACPAFPRASRPASGS